MDNYEFGIPCFPLSGSQGCKSFIKKLNLKKEIKKPLVVLVSLIVIYNILSIDHIEHAGSILRCKIRGGEILESRCDSIGCYIPYEDWGKDCRNDSECQGYCELEAEDTILELFKKNFPSQYAVCESSEENEVVISEWSEKVNFQIKGKCSKYSLDAPVSSRLIGVKDDMLHIKCPVLMIY